MCSVLLVGLIRTKTLKIPRLVSSLADTGYVTRVKMAGTLATGSIFKGKTDRFNGVTVDSVTEPCGVGAFQKCLEASLDQWTKDEKRAIWFRVDLQQSHWIPVLTDNGFKFHHAKDDWVTLYRWLPVNQTCNIPPYAHTMLGIGGIVYNDKTDEVLVVKEKYSVHTPMWKLPGGYMEPGEDVATAVEREVWEETGIKAEFQHLLTMRHAHQFAFGCSDLYMVACLTPRSYEITKCDRELTECKWMKLDEYVRHPDVHENNRLVAQKFVEHKNHRMSMKVDNLIHPVFKKPVAMFTIAKIED